MRYPRELGGMFSAPGGDVDGSVCGIGVFIAGLWGSARDEHAVVRNDGGCLG